MSHWLIDLSASTHHDAVGDGPFPGVIDMFGGVGGLCEHRASLLASRGFAAFALPYTAFDDLPETLELNLEYFKAWIEHSHSVY